MHYSLCSPPQQFVLFGIVAILSEKYPSSCLVSYIILFLCFVYPCFDINSLFWLKIPHYFWFQKYWFDNIECQCRQVNKDVFSFFLQIILNVVLNLFGVLFAIAAIVLYSIDLAIRQLELCDSYDGDYHNRHYETQCLKVQKKLLVSVAPEILYSWL